MIRPVVTVLWIYIYPLYLQFLNFDQKLNNFEGLHKSKSLLVLYATWQELF